MYCFDRKTYRRYLERVRYRISLWCEALGFYGLEMRYIHINISPDMLLKRNKYVSW